MKNNDATREFINHIKTLCKKTPYDIDIFESDSDIFPRVYIQKDAPKYTPYIDLQFYGDIFTINIQTTSYGAIDVQEITKVIESLTTAAKVADFITFQLELAGFIKHSS